MSAIFNADRTRRIVLSRGDETKPYIAFAGLNPSDAAEYEEDPTTRRLWGFARREGFEHWKIVNLDSWVSSNPALLRHVSQQYWLDAAHENGRVMAVCYNATWIVPCWGEGIKHLRHRGSAVPGWFLERACFGMAGKMRCFGKTKDGHPKHPLYLKADTPLIPFY